MTREQLNQKCEETQTSQKGIEILIDYYINSLGWSEQQAIDYAYSLFDNGTIEQIKMIGKDGEEL